jgi:Protein of unknown function DUF58
MNAEPAMPSLDFNRSCQAAQEWARVITLPFRQQRWRGQVGAFLGSATGSSLEFQDQRAYAPGDDPRQINWQAYARTGHYTMKQYREEARPLLDLVVDASTSMSAFPEKAQRVLELVAFAFTSARQVMAATQCLILTPNGHRICTNEESFQQQWQPQPNAQAPLLANLPLRSSSLCVWITDLLFPGSPESMLKALTASKRRVLILAPFSTQESEPTWAGNCEFLDAESDTAQAQRVDDSVLQHYRAAYTQHFQLWHDCCRSYQASFAKVSAETAFIQALGAEALKNGALEWQAS